jgi:hypothetical protein
VTWPDPARLLRHRPPALLLGRIAELDGDRLACTSRRAGPWRWAELLEGAAQSAGLLAGLQPGGPSNTAVIAEYRSVGVHAASHAGRVRFVARLERRVLDFWRCRVEARAADGTLLLDGRVTIAPR